MSTHSNWWQPYEAAAARGVEMSVWSAKKDERATALDEAIDDALRADAAGWFAKPEVIR